MGYIINSVDGPGYTAPRPRNKGLDCDDPYCNECKQEDKVAPAKPECTDPFCFHRDCDGDHAVPVPKHPAVAENERLSNFLSQHFPGALPGCNAVDAAIEILHSMLAVAAEAPVNMKAPARPRYDDYAQPPLNQDPRTVQPGEVRSVDPRTGAEKGTKLARFDLIPQGPLHELAEHFGVGAGKYADHQWRAGYDWSKSYAALGRHLSAFWSGEDIDPDPAMHGASHLAAAAWHVFALMEFHRTFPEGDDRWKVAR